MHPQRTALHNELHARPSLYFDGPAHVFHLALLGGDAACAALLQRCCPDALDTAAAQGITRLDGHPFKWERHTEFFTLTLVVPCTAADTEWQTLPPVLAEAIAPQAAQVINAVQVLVRDEQELDLPHYGFKDPCGSCVGGGDAVVWSDFRLTEDGTNRFLFINRRLNAYRQGRMIRRLLEIETYRMMASLTLTTAKDLSQELDAFDKTLVNLSERSAGVDDHDSKGLLEAIAHLSRQVVSRTVKTRQRFGATQAYAQLVFERLGELREAMWATASAWGFSSNAGSSRPCATARPPSSAWSSWQRMWPTWATCCRRGYRWKWKSRTPGSCAASMPGLMPR